MKVRPEKLLVSVKTRTGGLVFFRDNNEAHFRVEPFDHSEKKIVKVKKKKVCFHVFSFTTEQTLPLITKAFLGLNVTRKE